MSQKFPILGAFIITNKGYLLDAGIIESVGGKPHVERLPSKGIGTAREQLGLLFTLFYLYGDSKEVVQNRNMEENFLIWPADSYRKSLISEEFPGLVRYIKRYFPNKRTRDLYDIFDGKEFNKIFRVQRCKYQNFGIIQTGVLDPQNVFLLDVSPDKMSEVYELLKAFDTNGLARFRRERKQAEELIDLFRVAIKLGYTSMISRSWTGSGSGEWEPGTSENFNRITPSEVRKGIAETLREILRTTSVLVPDDWNDEINELEKSLLPDILANLSLEKHEIKQIQSFRLLLYESLQRSVNLISKSEFLLGLYHLRSGDNNMAVARFSEYCKKNVHDAKAWILLGKSLLGQNQCEEARKVFQKARREGQKIAPCLGIASSYKSYKEREAALEWIEKALINDNTSKAALTLKASWSRAYGDAKQALEILDGVVKRKPDYWPAILERASCLYSVGRYKDVVTEAKKILKKRTGPIKWVRYLLIASLYCLEEDKGDYEEAKKDGLVALEYAKDDTEKGYIHIVLRKIALKENSLCEMVHHSVQICRLIPEMQTAWLQLAADLEQSGHKKLAAWFWKREIDYSELGIEVVVATRLFTQFSKWDKAVRCACLLKEEGGFQTLVKCLSRRQLGLLCARLVYLLEMRLTGQIKGHWKEPFAAIKNLAKVAFENEAVLYSHYAAVAALAASVRDSKSAQLWAAEWEKIAHEQATSVTKCLACWSIYNQWCATTRHPEIPNRLVKFGIDAANQEMAANNAGGLNSSAVCSSLVALLEICDSNELDELITRFRDWIDELDPGIAPGLCLFSLEQLMYRLLRHGKLECATGFTKVALRLLRSTDRADLKQYLANAAALGCVAYSGLLKDAGMTKFYMDELETQISRENNKKLPEDFFILAEMNLAYARAGWICNYESAPENELDKLIEKTLGRLSLSKSMDRKWVIESTIQFMGGVAERAANISLNNLVMDIMRQLEELFGSSDTHARYLARLKRRLKDIVDRRPLGVAGFICPEEELDRASIEEICRKHIIQGTAVEFGKDVIADFKAISEQMNKTFDLDR